MITFGHNCPHCGVKNGGFEVVNYYFVQRYELAGQFTLVALCNSCSHSVVTDLNICEKSTLTNYIGKAKSMLDSLNKYNLEELLVQANCLQPKFYPNHEPQLEIPAYLPDGVLRAMRTAEKLFIQAKGDEDMLNSAGNAYRATLEAALALLDDGSDKGLNWRINALVQKGMLVQPMGDFAHRIRLLGNEATHAEINLPALTELRLFMSLFLQYTFTLPAMIPKESND